MATARTKCISTKVTADEYARFARAGTGADRQRVGP